MSPFQNDVAGEENIEQLAQGAGDDVQAALDAVSQGDFTAALPLLSNYLWPAIQVLLLLIVGYFVARFVGRIVSRPIRSRVDETLGKFVGRLVYYAIMISIVVAVLGKFGFQVTSFAAILASAGFAIGMAFQGTLGNFAAGIMLLVFRPFKVGDVISAAGVKAKVDAIDLFTTTLDTPDNRRFIVPNSSVTGGTIENISYHNERRVEVTVGCDYGADLKETRRVLTLAVESLQDRIVMGEGRGFQVVLTGLGDSSVNWAVRAWTKSDAFLEVSEALIEAVKTSLDAAGIGIPYPTMDVHVTQSA